MIFGMRTTWRENAAHQKEELKMLQKSTRRRNNRRTLGKSRGGARAGGDVISGFVASAVKTPTFDPHGATLCSTFNLRRLEGLRSLKIGHSVPKGTHLSRHVLKGGTEARAKFRRSEGRVKCCVRQSLSAAIP